MKTLLVLEFVVAFVALGVRAFVSQEGRLFLEGVLVTAGASAVALAVVMPGSEREPWETL